MKFSIVKRLMKLNLHLEMLTIKKKFKSLKALLLLLQSETVFPNQEISMYKTKLATLSLKLILKRI